MSLNGEYSNSELHPTHAGRIERTREDIIAGQFFPIFLLVHLYPINVIINLFTACDTGHGLLSQLFILYYVHKKLTSWKYDWLAHFGGRNECVGSAILEAL